jgi:hypothetical protein
MAASSAANPAATIAFLATFLDFLATLVSPEPVRFFVDLYNAFAFLVLLLFDFGRERVEADIDFVRRADFFIFSSGVDRLRKRPYTSAVARRPCLK